MEILDWDRLRKVASDTRTHAYVPYSSFAVGAAILDEDGKIFSGCNVENASYGLTNCAERTAVFNMVSSGGRKIRALAVVAGSPRAISPCGACRQVLAEFAHPDTPVFLSNLDGDTIETTIGQLLPYGFSGDDMDR